MVLLVKGRKFEKKNRLHEGNQTNNDVDCSKWRYHAIRESFWHFNYPLHSSNERHASLIVSLLH
jgi:hypothetical protein